MKNLVKLVVRTHAQVKWWSYAGWTLPFVALAAIIFEYHFGHDNWLKITSLAVIIVFFSAAVFWWWWALNRVAVVIESMNNASEIFLEIKEDLKETKKTIREIDADNRKRREQIRN